MKRRLDILWANLITSFRKDTAYFAENWSNVLSTVFYTLMQIAFIEILFGNIDSIAEFSKNDVYFMLFLAQIHFYFIMETGFNPSLVMANAVNYGGLDFLMLRPVPTKWFIFTSPISFLRIIRDGLPPMIPLFILVDWSMLSISSSAFMTGLGIYLLGFIIVASMIRILAYSSFWTGSSSNFIINYYWAMSIRTEIPFNPLPTWFKGMIFFLFPSYIPAALATSVMLGYSAAGYWLTVTGIATAFWILLESLIWKRGLRRYTSASS